MDNYILSEEEYEEYKRIVLSADDNTIDKCTRIMSLFGLNDIGPKTISELIKIIQGYK